MNRRNFLKHTCHSLALPGVFSTLGISANGQSMRNLLKLAADSNRVLVMVYLEGGNDGLNTVIPLSQLSTLNSLRPHVALPDQSLLELQNADVTLHPSLSGFKNLYNEGKLSIVQNVGYPDPNYSHFRSTDIWMSGSGSNELVDSGWTGRFLADKHPEYPEEYPEDGEPLAIELGYGSSLLFQGDEANMGMVIRDPNAFYELIENEEEEAPDTPAGEKLKYVRLIARQSQQFGEIVRDAANQANNLTSYPLNNLAEQLKIVARLIAGGLSTPLYLVKIGGFDTHEGQVDQSDHTKGLHADLLSELDTAISAFMTDIESHGMEDSVLGMTFSEFGRRVVSNASMGTDHGSSAPMFFFGNAVKRGVLGSDPYIDPSATYEYNLDAEIDFRQLYASVMEQWLGASAQTSSNILFSEFQNLDIIGEDLVLKSPSKATSKIYPNPLNGQASIELYSTGHQVSIRLFDVQGRDLGSIYSGRPEPGHQNIFWDTSQIPSGRYFVVIESKGMRETLKVIK